MKIRICAVILSLQSILDEPHPFDPIVPEIAEQLLKTPETFKENARLYTQRYAMTLPPILKEIKQKQLAKLKSLSPEQIEQLHSKFVIGDWDANRAR